MKWLKRFKKKVKEPELEPIMVLKHKTIFIVEHRDTFEIVKYNVGNFNDMKVSAKIVRKKHIWKFVDVAEKNNASLLSKLERERINKFIEDINGWVYITCE